MSSANWAPSRSAGRYRTSRFIYWTHTFNRCLLEPPVRSLLVARAWLVATFNVPILLPSDSSHIRSAGCQVNDCIEAETWLVTTATAVSSFWVEQIIRSSCVDFALSWARLKLFLIVILT